MTDGPLPKELVSWWQSMLTGPALKDTSLICDYIFDSDLFPLQRKAEMKRMLLEAVAIHPTTVMEIGTDKGGSLFHWCRLPGVERVIACETRGTPFSALFEEAFPAIDFLWLPYDSYERATVKLVEKFLGNYRIDCLFLDGDKSHFDLDFDSYKHLVSGNGIVFFHDITDSPTGDHFWKIVGRGYRSAAIVDLTDTVEMRKRRDAGEPAVGSYEQWLRCWDGQSCGVGVLYMKQ